MDLENIKEIKIKDLKTNYYYILTCRKFLVYYY